MTRSYAQLIAPLLLLLIASEWGEASAATYPSNRDLESQVESLVSKNSKQLSVETLVEGRDGRPIQIVTAGSGDPSNPAILVVGGLDGRHLVGTSIVLAQIESLADGGARTDSLLDGRTLYLVPRLNPAGATAILEQAPKRARGTTEGVADLDKDGLEGEDLADDLDGNGWISSVRVEDPTGEWVLDGPGGDFLRKAKREEGEAGAWRLLAEGRDDDQDHLWNEEEDGGVLLAANFPFGYEWFARNRGSHQVSENETRAIADFLVAHPNVGVVLVYGFEDNLLRPLPDGKTSNPNLGGQRWGRQVIDQPNEHDLSLFQEISRRYRAGHGLDRDAPKLAHRARGVELEMEEQLSIPDHDTAANGGLGSWSYYHRGRLGLATPGWTPALQMALVAADEAAVEAAEESEGDESSPDGEDGDAETDSDSDSDSDSDESDVPPEPDYDEAVIEEQEFRDWLVTKDPTAWLGWTDLDHPDFSGQRAEAGGYAPLARVNPPESEFERIADVNIRFVEDLLHWLPEISLRSIELEPLASGLHELRFTVENLGLMPDVLGHGVYSTVVRPTRYELGLPSGAEVMGGAPRARIERIEGSGGEREVRLLLRLPQGGPVGIEIISELGGRDRREIRSGEEWRANR